MSTPLVRLLLGADPPGSAVSNVFGGVCTAWAWDTVSAPTNTVVANTTTYSNLSAVNPAAMSTGLVLLISGPAGPIILGRLY